MLINAATYGFIERYPQGLENVTGYSPEAWHWRYVGPAIAQEMKSKGIKTLEQLWNISGGGY
jgi:D-alanyl-D-alanine carboxypeptidase